MDWSWFPADVRFSHRAEINLNCEYDATFARPLVAPLGTLLPEWRSKCREDVVVATMFLLVVQLP